MSSSTATTPSSASSRFHELQSSFPPVTLAIIVTCCSVYLFQIVFHLDMSRYTLCPRLVLYLHEYYRCITSTLFHANLMHLGMNMMSTSAISASLERKVGSLRHAYSILWAVLMTSVVYILMAWMMHVVLGNDTLLYQHAVGFSGVLFHLCVLESNQSSGNQSVFGIFSVPSYLYPWVLLLVLQVIMPNISFTGHLAGILTGTLELYGVWNAYLIPTDHYLLDMEQWRILRPLIQYPTFCSTPPPPSANNFHNSHRDVSAIRHAFGQGMCWLWKWVKDLFECLQYCLLGRGRHANANLYLPTIARTQIPTTSAANSGRSRLLMTTTTTTTTPTAPWSLETEYLDDADQESHNEQRSLLPPQQQQQQPQSSSSPRIPPTVSRLL